MKKSELTTILEDYTEAFGDQPVSVILQDIDDGVIPEDWFE